VNVKSDYFGHLPHLLSLAGILLVGTVGLVGFAYDRDVQLAVAVALPVAYFVWGVVHHLLHDELYWRIVIEYAVVALFGGVVLVSVILRA